MALYVNCFRKRHNETKSLGHNQTLRPYIYLSGFCQDEQIIGKESPYIPTNNLTWVMH